MTDYSDHRWHFWHVRPATAVVQYIDGGRNPFQNSKGQAVRRVQRARIFRNTPDGKREEDGCPGWHYHRTVKGARECGEAAARRLNRKLQP